MSKIEASILRSSEPIPICETQEITAAGNRGIFANRCEVCTWKGDLPINEYPINEDACPNVINKRLKQKLEYVQEMAVRYLKPPTPPAPGEIIIKQEPNYSNIVYASNAWLRNYLYSNNNNHHVFHIE